MYKFNQNRTLEDLKKFTFDFATLSTGDSIPEGKSYVMGIID
jgi:hypothetical protein